MWRYFPLHTLHCTVLHCTAPHCTALHCTALHSPQPGWPGPPCLMALQIAARSLPPVARHNNRYTRWRNSPATGPSPLTGGGHRCRRPGQGTIHSHCTNHCWPLPLRTPARGGGATARVAHPDGAGEGDGRPVGMHNPHSLSPHFHRPGWPRHSCLMALQIAARSLSPGARHNNRYPGWRNSPATGPSPLPGGGTNVAAAQAREPYTRGRGLTLGSPEPPGNFPC
jgi:hypothetical protein